MLKGKSFVVLTLLTAAVVAGAALTLKREDPMPERGTLMFPGLLERVNEVAQVDVVSGGERFSLERDASTWIAPERHGYRLDGDKVHQLLVGTAGLARIEPKTSKPELYAKLGLEDPSGKGAQSERFTFKSDSGDVLADLIVGERRPSRGNPTGWEYFVRKPEGEHQSWLAEGSLPSGTKTLTEWLDRGIVAIAEDRIKSVSVTHSDGEVVTMEKAAPSERDYRYRQLPEGAEVEDSWRLNDIGRLLVDLSLEDVKSASGEAALGDDVMHVVVETFDGLRVSGRVGQPDNEPLAAFTASFDSELAQAAASFEVDELKSADAVREEAQQLEDRWKDWVYVLPKYKADYLRKKKADLVKAVDGADKAGANG